LLQAGDSVQEREINAMAKIQHPHVIRLKEVDWDAQYPKRNGNPLDIFSISE